MTVKTFQEYLTEGIVKRINPDFERSKNLIKVSERKISSFEENTKKVGLKDDNANDYIEYCCDIIMTLIRAKMLSEGYNASGVGAHEAEVAYLINLKFNEADARFLDQIRFFRNGMMYYGTILDKEYAEKVIVFLKRIYPKLKSTTNQK
jgi:hypothetical protein